MKNKDKLKLPKRGIWGGYEVLRIGPKSRGYFWIGQGTKYLMALTRSEAKQVAKFLQT